MSVDLVFDHVLSTTFATSTHRLSNRQRDVLEAMSRGLSYPEAAAELGIGLETVKHHMKAARQRLDARNTNHAIAIAVREGLIR